MARKRVTQAEEWQAWAKRYDIDGGIRNFESGLTLKVFLGALFVGLLMMPGSLYLTFVSGEAGAAAAGAPLPSQVHLSLESDTTRGADWAYLKCDGSKKPAKLSSTAATVESTPARGGS